MFLCKVLPQAWILQNSSLDEFNSVLHDDWLDTPCAGRSSDLLALILERLVTRIPEGIFSQLSLYDQYTRQYGKVMLQSAYFRTLSLSLGNHQFMLAKWFPLRCQPMYIKIRSTRSAIFIIDICIDNRPFNVFVNRKEEGVGDLKCGDVGETNRFGRCFIWA